MDTLDEIGATLPMLEGLSVCKCDKLTSVTGLIKYLKRATYNVNVMVFRCNLVPQDELVELERCNNKLL